MANATLRLGQRHGAGFEYRDYRWFEVTVGRDPDPVPGGGQYLYYLHGDYYCDYRIYRDCLRCFWDPGQAMNAKDMLESLLNLLEQGMEPDSALDRLTEDFPDLDVRGLLTKCGYVPEEGVSAT